MTSKFDRRMAPLVAALLTVCVFPALIWGQLTTIPPTVLYTCSSGVRNGLSLYSNQYAATCSNLAQFPANYPGQL